MKVKRTVDLVGAAVGLLVSSPLLVGVAICLKAQGQVLFRQERPGYKGSVFTIYKFRTMREPTANESRYRTDADRVTPIGQFLRKTSLDELPELWNVLRGEMSLVGPRPLLMEYLPKYTETELRRHDMPPGITGWAQVNGRQNIPFSQRLLLDVWYVDHWSLLLDVKILFRTLAAVLFSAHGSVESAGLDIVDDIGLSADRVRENQSAH